MNKVYSITFTTTHEQELKDLKQDNDESEDDEGKQVVFWSQTEGEQMFMLLKKG